MRATHHRLPCRTCCEPVVPHDRLRPRTTRGVRRFHDGTTEGLPLNSHGTTGYAGPRGHRVTPGRNTARPPAARMVSTRDYWLP